MANVVELLFKTVPRTPIDECEYWATDSLILARTQDGAERLADMMEGLFGIQCATGYFDPAEDARDGLCDECTGYYYVDFD